MKVRCNQDFGNIESLSFSESHECVLNEEGQPTWGKNVTVGSLVSDKSFDVGGEYYNVRFSGNENVQFSWLAFTQKTTGCSENDLGPPQYGYAFVASK